MNARIENPPVIYSQPRFILPFQWDTNTAGTVTNTRVYLAQFNVEFPITVDAIQFTNGGTVNGNVTVGIYSAGATDTPAAGTLVATSASTAQSGTSVPQTIQFTDTAVLQPGQYWIAFASSSATATFMKMSFFEAGTGWAMYFDQAYGALPSTCPAVTQTGAGLPAVAVRTA